MDKDLIIKKTVDYVRKTLKNDSTGHDWWHIYRVWEISKKIADKEKGADLFIVELAALLHDIADWKFHNGNETAGENTATEWLKSQDLDNSTVLHVAEIVKNVSFKGAKVKNKIKSIEGMIVQDADRLDALGAIGIARVFATGSKFGIPIYDSNLKPKIHKNFKDYKSNQTSSINHFYEKLLLLKDLMNTKTGKIMAEKRHKFMEKYLNEFYKEWEGKDL